MTWLDRVAEGETPFERAFGLRRDLFEHYRVFYAQLWQDRLVDPIILELCRLRVAQLHRSASELAVRYQPAIDAGLTEEKVAALASWPTSPLYTDHERACLAYTEKFVIDVHTITDDESAAVAAGMSSPEVVALSLALGLFDGLGRFRMILDLEPPFEHVTVVPAPLTDGGTLY